MHACYNRTAIIDDEKIIERAKIFNRKNLVTYPTTDGNGYLSVMQLSYVHEVYAQLSVCTVSTFSVPIHIYIYTILRCFHLVSFSIRLNYYVTLGVSSVGKTLVYTAHRSPLTLHFINITSNECIFSIIITWVRLLILSDTLCRINFVYLHTIGF